jgi:hypothetical protein
VGEREGSIGGGTWRSRILASAWEKEGCALCRAREELGRVGGADVERRECWVMETASRGLETWIRMKRSKVEHELPVRLPALGHRRESRHRPPLARSADACR